MFHRVNNRGYRYILLLVGFEQKINL